LHEWKKIWRILRANPRIQWASFTLRQRALISGEFVCFSFVRRD